MQPTVTSAPLLVIASCLAALLFGCLDAEPPPTDAGGDSVVTIEVAPLTLDGVTDADYTIRVTNAPNGGGDVVWERTSLTSSQYGDGAGSLSYVGPCDADTVGNSVTLTLVGLSEGNGVPVAEETYENPGPLTRNVDCVANTDVSVSFDITVVRHARQGFFDVAVDFDNVFCAAKLDCVDEAGGPLRLLHNDLDERDRTAVMGFACTGDPSGDTFLYMDDPIITCDGIANVTIKASEIGTLDVDQSPHVNAAGYLFGAAIYRGEESLASKAYWNIALGLDDSTFGTAGNCTLIGRATASDAPAFPQTLDGFPLPEGSVYPVIDWSVQLTNDTAVTCGAHAVNVAGSGVATDYLGWVTAPGQFSFATETIALDHRYDPSANGILSATTCTPACANGGVCVGENTCDCEGTGHHGGSCDIPDTLELIISADTQNYNVATQAGPLTDPIGITVTIEAGVVVSGTSTYTPALQTGTLPAGTTLTVVNHGYIIGKGGNGTSGTNGGVVLPGRDGGDALKTTVPLTIDNTDGNIWGGGGGGAGSRGDTNGNCHNMQFGDIWGGNGGGGAGGGLGASNSGPPATAADGTTGPGGGGGTGSYGSWGGSSNFNMRGGYGGGYGSPGGGGNEYSGYCIAPDGGAAGASVVAGGQSLTWLGGNTAQRVKGPIE